MVDSAGPRTVGDLWVWLVREHGDDPFLTFEEQAGAVSHASYAQFDVSVNQVANLLASHSVRKGDNVAIQTANCPQFLVTQFALAKIGAVAVPVNAEYVREECRYIVKKCGTRVAVVGEQWAPQYADMPGIDLLVVIGRADQPFGSTPCVAFDTYRAQPRFFDCDPGITCDDAAMILFTSGTTAAPKGVVITHANCVFAGLYGNWQTAMSKADRMLTPMAVAHSNFQLAALMPVLTAGCQLILESRYSATRFWGEVRRNHATLVQTVSMIVRTLLKQPVSAEEKDNDVRDILYYLPLSDAEKRAFEERFAVTVLNSYGSTESVGWVITDFACGERRWPSVGRPGLGYEAKIVDPDSGAELPPGSDGEILVKGVPGRTMMKGYYGDPTATAAAIDADGWLHTRDRGLVDADGWFYFTGRAADLIKRSGENISALEIEHVLEENPDVAEAAVIGVPDPIRDEAVKAFILPEKGHDVSADAVEEYLECHLAEFKMPSSVEIVGTLPHTSTGKIAKHLLDHHPIDRSAINERKQQ